MYLHSDLVRLMLSIEGMNHTMILRELYSFISNFEESLNHFIESCKALFVNNLSSELSGLDDLFSGKNALMYHFQIYMRHVMIRVY